MDDPRRYFATASQTANRACLLWPAFFLAVVFLAAPAAYGWEETATSQQPVFETSVQPVLQSKCGKCHSTKVRKADLDLSSMNGIRKGGESGELLVAEQEKLPAKRLEKSHLWQVISDELMPPDGEPALTTAEVKQIRTWLESGARARQVASRAPVVLHDVLPILLLRCATCHGERIQRAGIALHQLEAIRRNGDNGPPLVAGKPDQSLIIQRVESGACPPQEQLLKYFVKRPPSNEVDKLRQWIADGAQAGNLQADVASDRPDTLVSDTDRRHWAFQPLQPAILQAATSLDQFVDAKLAAAGLSRSPPASRDTLIRRAYFDLVGLPPSLAEWKRWRQDQRPRWFAHLVDELLASPRYGERWGRYWLDLAGYADSEGGVSADPVRQVAWKYRDYVIDAFNRDTPYDQFLREQLAGDELIDYEQADQVTEEMVRNLTATGFLRMSIDQTGSRTMNFVPERLGVIADALDIVSSGLMGLTMNCARCHSHKYDPIPHRDYYRLKAIFQGAYDEHDWLTFKNRKLRVATAAHRKLVATTNPPLEKELKQLGRKIKQATTDLQLTMLRSHYPDQPEADRQRTIAALRIADNNRTLPQRILVEKLQRVEAINAEQQPPAVVSAVNQLQQLSDRVAKLRRKLVAPLAIRALWDRGSPSPTYILRRGEHDKPGHVVGPGVPSVLTDGETPFVVTPPFPQGTPKSGRRLAFARWLTEPNHPLTARVITNRIWYHHFGAGIVRSLENFGVKGEPPSHPRLLDWLSVSLVQSGWSIKQLHRTIMLSKTYQQSSRVDQRRHQLDPSNRLLSRMPLRRLDAEALRDSLLAISGTLDLHAGGPPDPVSVARNGEVRIRSFRPGLWRRSIYAQYRRTELPTMLTTFDYPEMGPNCSARTNSTSSPQPLLMMNNRGIRQQATYLAQRVAQVAGEHPTKQIRYLYQLALSRPPNNRELELGRQALQQLTKDWRDSQRALETYCHTIINSANFLYVD